jgi:hypothetical protein
VREQQGERVTAGAAEEEVCQAVVPHLRTNDTIWRT